MEVDDFEFACQVLDIDSSIVTFDGDYFVKSGRFDFDECKFNYNLKQYKDSKFII
ncbi:hypothetical protein [Paraclostridium sordellii]|uniref:hypothetical protein n=1 Tax=Paraclostridium sordellii TaxID=1505 RepID=UPI000B0987FD|nr:hypothetical protein [Paeniclostridium sordellii]